MQRKDFSNFLVSEFFSQFPFSLHCSFYHPVHEIPIINSPLIPGNNGGVNCELKEAKWGGKNNGGCPSMRWKFPLWSKNETV